LAQRIVDFDPRDAEGGADRQERDDKNRDERRAQAYKAKALDAEGDVARRRPFERGFRVGRVGRIYRQSFSPWSLASGVLNAEDGI
jgi:hypothetical protein